MIKFFRKIRQKLLVENRFNKYLLYATGEIFLVVIGILIALQINNWNENRKSKENEVVILKQLNADLNKNLEEIGEIKRELIKRKDNCKNYLNFLLSSKSSSDSITLWLKNIDKSPIFNNANTAYKNIENSSNKIISNDSLRLRITLMYEREFKNIHVRESYYMTNSINEFGKQQRENFITTMHISQQKNDTLFQYNTPKNLLSLKKNDTYKNSLVDIYKMNQLRIRFLTETEHRLKLLIQDINDEIKYLND